MMRLMLSISLVVLSACANGASLGCRCGDLHCNRAACFDGAVDDTGTPDIDASADGGTIEGHDAAPSVDAFSGHDAFAGNDAFTGNDAFAGHDAFVSPDMGRDAFVPPTERCDGIDQDGDSRIDEGTFVASFITDGDTTWQHYDLTCTSSSAPHAPIQTVFDIESLRRAYFLTATTYHVLDLSTRTWLASGSRNSIMPQLSGVTLSVAYTVPAGWAGSSASVEGLTLGTLGASPMVYFYDINISTPSNVQFAFGAVTAPATNPRAWTPTFPSEQSMYVTVTNTWDLDPSTVCGSPTYHSGPYGALFAATEVQILDVGSCFLPIATVPISSFGPFTYATAPARSAWNQTVWNQGIWLFAQPTY